MSSRFPVFTARYGRRALIRKLPACFGVLPLLAAGPAAAREIRLMMLGDSITAGYGLPRGQALPVRLEAALRERGRTVRVLDAGVSGDTTAGGRARLDWALAERPDAVIVALGGNDGLRGLAPAATQANLAAILDALAARRLPAMLAGMLAPPNLGADYGRDFAATFTRLAEARPEVVFYPFLLDGVAGDPALNQPDRIHPNEAGVAELVRRMLPAVESLLGRVPSG
ncbi:arylesterase [Roseomonas sp. PWR1]|uniref:Arylesterase n=1 Tax=Roseomonas nitratireducens TaxID=2820810 RepID=A0ABS4AXM3_9PROT|nr:arylesterase [Neoroseomonas nitratireducens]